MPKLTDYRDTLVVWLRSNSAKEAAATMGLTYATLYARIARMRKAGVNVPNHNDFVVVKSLSNLEVAQMNSMISKHLKAVKEQ